MNLHFDTSHAEGYSSNSQKARVLTEFWVKDNAYCPGCGTIPLYQFENNRPVADFYCRQCNEEFELKSKKGNFTNTVMDGAFETMIQRLESNIVPNFFLLTYSAHWTVNNFIIIPKQFFTFSIIIRRNPLPPHARRAGWTGCNIDISGVPDAGRVHLVKNGTEVNRTTVKEAFNRTSFMRKQKSDAKGWIIDTMNCIDAIEKTTFKLSDMYAFEEALRRKYPNNNFIKDKLRQQLQNLRDKGIIEFISPGVYRKVQL
ncbi:MAG: restriction endonuclease [Ignavibacteria bacterium]|nr:restriction endonuclease [Ignavibacteria bacterium]